MTAQLVAMQAKLIEAMTQMTRPAVLEKSQPIFSLSQHEATRTCYIYSWIPITDLRQPRALPQRQSLWMCLLRLPALPEEC